MTRVRLACPWLAAAGIAALLLTAPRAAAQVVELPDRSPSDQSQGPVNPVYQSFRSAVRLGQDYRLGAGDEAREVTVIMGNAQIDGRVEGDVAVIMGSAYVASTASIGGSLVVIGGTVKIYSGASVRGDMVSIGGGIDAPIDFRPGGESVVLGPNIFGGRLESLFPWITRGLLWGRPIVPGLPWVWGIVALFFLLYLSINLVFHQAVRTCAETLNARPLTAFIVGLLVLLLTGPVSVLLAVTVVGLAIVPVVICAVLVAGVIGRVCVIRWLGLRVMPEESPDSQVASMRSFAIGFAILSVPYMVPILGFVVFALVGVLGLGAAALSFIAGYRKENPVPPRPAVPPAPPTAPTPPGAFGTFGSGNEPFDPSPILRTDSGAESAGPLPTVDAASDYQRAPAFAPPPMPPSVPSGTNFGTNAGTGLTGLTMFPHATFLERLAAFVLDLILVVIACQMLPVLNRADGDGLFMALLAYHIGFWTWKGTTVGGIICQLRLVRIDGTLLRFVDALVRGLSAIFSLIVLGIGALWILKDPDRQAWHDKIAGTYVVKVPRHWPI